MTAAPRRPDMVKFAGGIAIFGFWCMGFYAAMTVLLVAMLGLAGATGSWPFPIGAAEILTWLACVAGVVWFVRVALRPLRQVRTVTLDAEGTWILRNCVGKTIGRIPANEPRTVTMWSQEVRRYGPSVRRWTRSHGKLVTANATWMSSYSIPSETSAAVSRLLAPPFAAAPS